MPEWAIYSGVSAQENKVLRTGDKAQLVVSKQSYRNLYILIQLLDALKDDKLEKDMRT